METVCRPLREHPFGQRHAQHVYEFLRARMRKARTSLVSERFPDRGVSHANLMHFAAEPHRHQVANSKSDWPVCLLCSKSSTAWTRALSAS